MGKIWEWDLSFRWEWDGNGNEVIEMGGNWYEKSVPAHLYTVRVGSDGGIAYVCTVGPIDHSVSRARIYLGA